jgi:hypothetical protein
MTPGELNEFLLSQTSEISRYTPALFRYVPGRESHFGSGVLLTVGNVRFLLTAAHVADEFFQTYKKIFFGTPTTDDLLPVGFERWVLSKPGSDPNRDDDRVDTAVLELQPSIAEKLASFMRFLTLNDLELDPDKLVGGVYLVNGYPDFRAERDEMDEVIVAQNLPYLTSLYDAEQSPASKINPVDHIAVEVHAPNSSGGLSDGLNLDTAVGISGGGIWRMLDDNEPIDSLDWRKSKLVGIVTDRSDPEHAGPIHYLRATKIKHVIRMIWFRWLELRSEIASVIPLRFFSDPT